MCFLAGIERIQGDIDCLIPGRASCGGDRVLMLETELRDGASTHAQPCEGAAGSFGQLRFWSVRVRPSGGISLKVIQRVISGVLAISPLRTA